MYKKRIRKIYCIQTFYVINKVVGDNGGNYQWQMRPVKFLKFASHNPLQMFIYGSNSDNPHMWEGFLRSIVEHPHNTNCNYG